MRCLHRSGSTLSRSDYSYGAWTEMDRRNRCESWSESRHHRRQCWFGKQWFGFDYRRVAHLTCLCRKVGPPPAILNGTKSRIPGAKPHIRRGFDGLSAHVPTVLPQQLFSGHVFIFRWWRGDIVKCLSFTCLPKACPCRLFCSRLAGMLLWVCVGENFEFSTRE